MTTAMAAFQPKVFSMVAMSRPHFSATMRTGGAAKGVSVPPIEMLTNSTPTVTYMKFFGAFRPRNRSRSSSAASVIAAGSVMNEPSKGANRKDGEVIRDGALGRQDARQESKTRPAKSMIGRLAAITMMTKTNAGSVKFRLSR